VDTLIGIISRDYPGNPKASIIKVIFAGKLYDRDTTIEAVLKNRDLSEALTLHFIAHGFTPQKSNRTPPDDLRTQSAPAGRGPAAAAAAADESRGGSAPAASPPATAQGILGESKESRDDGVSAAATTAATAAACSLDSSHPHPTTPVRVGGRPPLAPATPTEAPFAAGGRPLPGGLAGGRRPTTSWDPFSASPQFSPAVAPYQMQPAYQLQQLQQRQQQQQMQVQMQMQQYVISKEEEEEERKKRGREDGGTKRTSPLRW
jgi:hypothetical protein